METFLNGDLSNMTDDIAKVRAAYLGAHNEAYGQGIGIFGPDDKFLSALAKRLQPRPEPPKKVWQASPAVALKFATVWHQHNKSAGVLADYRKPVDAIAPDIIRERPDLVAAEYQRRYRVAFGVEASLNNLFPELDP